MGYGGGAPSWVYKREIASREMHHSDETRNLRQRVEELEKENAELKSKLEKIENAILISLELLTKGF